MRNPPGGDTTPENEGVMQKASRFTRCSLAGTAVILSVLLACPNPLTQSMLNRVKDGTPPEVEILYPADGSPYAAAVLVGGIATDRSDDPGTPGQVNSLAYEVLATTIAGTVPVDEEGSFEFAFKTTALSGNLVIRLRATDWNGNVTEASLTLVGTGSQVPSFAAVAGNQRVVLSWDPVPLAESYTLHYTTSGAIPSENYGVHVPDVNSPFTLTGLANGRTHGFLLQVHAAEGAEYFSLPLQAIPVSSSTLVPHSRSEYGKVVLEWPETPGSMLFDVERSASLAGPYAPLVRDVSGNRYEDREVGTGETCFYRVRSALPGSPPSAPCWGAGCPFPEEWLEKVGSVPGLIITAVPAVAVGGSIAYELLQINAIFVHPSGIFAYDISNPSSPQKLAEFRIGVKTLPMGGADHLGCDLAVHEGLVFVAGPEPTELSVVDFSDPVNPVRLGICGGFDEVQGLEVVAPLVDPLYLIGADGFAGLKFVDLSDPDSPSIFDQCPTNGYASDVCCDPSEPDLLYVADGNAGLTVIDRLGGTSTSCDTGDWARRVECSGTYAFVGEVGTVGESAKIVVVDAAIPASPFKVAEVVICDGPVELDLALDGNLLYVSAGAEGLRVLNVADPPHPVLMGADRTAVAAASVAAGDGVIVMSDLDLAGVLKIYRMSDLRPRPEEAMTLAAGGPGGLASDGRYLYTGNGAGMNIVDIATGTVAASYTTLAASYTYRILVHGATLLLSIGDFLNWSRLEILDISDPLNPKLCTHFDFPGAVWFSEVSGDLAFFVGTSGFQVADLSIPASPAILGSLGLAGTPVAAAATGDMVCVAANTGGLQVVDISDPGNLRRIGDLPLPGSALCVGVRDNHAFVGTDTLTESRLYAVDIRDPDDPKKVGSVALTDLPTQMVISGSYAYLLESGDHLEVADISDPKNPTIVASLTLTTDNFSGVVVAGSRVYVNQGVLSVIELNP